MSTAGSNLGNRMLMQRFTGIVLFPMWMAYHSPRWIMWPNVTGTGRQQTVWQALSLVAVMWQVAYWAPMPEDLRIRD